MNLRDQDTGYAWIPAALIMGAVLAIAWLCVLCTPLYADDYVCAADTCATWRVDQATGKRVDIECKRGEIIDTKNGWIIETGSGWEKMMGPDELAGRMP